MTDSTTSAPDNQLAATPRITPDVMRGLQVMSLPALKRLYNEAELSGYWVKRRWILRGVLLKEEARELALLDAIQSEMSRRAEGGVK